MLPYPTAHEVHVSSTNILDLHPSISHKILCCTPIVPPPCQSWACKWKWTKMLNGNIWCWNRLIFMGMKYISRKASEIQTRKFLSLLETHKLAKKKKIKNSKGPDQTTPPDFLVILPSVGLFHWTSVQGTNLGDVGVDGVTTGCRPCTHRCSQLSLRAPLPCSAHLSLLQICWAGITPGWVLPLEASAHPIPLCTHSPNSTLHPLLPHAADPCVYSRQGKEGRIRPQKPIETSSNISLCFGISQAAQPSVPAPKSLEIHGKFGRGAHAPAAEYTDLNVSMCQSSFLGCWTPRVFVGI